MCLTGGKNALPVFQTCPPKNQSRPIRGGSGLGIPQLTKSWGWSCLWEAVWLGHHYPLKFSKYFRHHDNEQRLSASGRLRPMTPTRGSAHGPCSAVDSADPRYKPSAVAIVCPCQCVVSNIFTWSFWSWLGLLSCNLPHHCPASNVLLKNVLFVVAVVVVFVVVATSSNIILAQSHAASMPRPGETLNM